MEEYTISYDAAISLKVRIYYIFYSLIMLWISWMHLTDKSGMNIIYYPIFGMAIFLIAVIVFYPFLLKVYGSRFVRFDQEGIEFRERIFQSLTRIPLEKIQLVKINPISVIVSYAPNGEKDIQFLPAYEQVIEARQKIIHWAKMNGIAIEDWRIKARHA